MLAGAVDAAALVDGLFAAPKEKPVLGVGDGAAANDLFAEPNENPVFTGEALLPPLLPDAPLPKPPKVKPVVLVLAAGAAFLSSDAALPNANGLALADRGAAEVVVEEDEGGAEEAGAFDVPLLPNENPVEGVNVEPEAAGLLEAAPNVNPEEAGELLKAFLAAEKVDMEEDEVGVGPEVLAAPPSSLPASSLLVEADGPTAGLLEPNEKPVGLAAGAAAGCLEDEEELLALPKSTFLPPNSKPPLGRSNLGISLGASTLAASEDPPSEPENFWPANEKPPLGRLNLGGPLGPVSAAFAGADVAAADGVGFDSVAGAVGGAPDVAALVAVFDVAGLKMKLLDDAGALLTAVDVVGCDEEGRLLLPPLLLLRALALAAFSFINSALFCSYFSTIPRTTGARSANSWSSSLPSSLIAASRADLSE